MIPISRLRNDCGARGLQIAELTFWDVELSGVGKVPEVLLIYQQVLMESVDDWPMAKVNSRHRGQA